MTDNVFGGTLSLTQSINQSIILIEQNVHQLDIVLCIRLLLLLFCRIFLDFETSISIVETSALLFVLLVIP